MICLIRFKVREDVDCVTDILSAEEGIKCENISTLREPLYRKVQNEIVIDDSEMQ